jgi:hypothetical protein
MQNPINSSASARDPEDNGEKLHNAAPRLLEVPGTIPTPPKGYAPDYFENEFAEKPVREFLGYCAPDIERPGYRLQRSWAPEEGLNVWIDHCSDAPFTVLELRDLIATLTETLNSVDNESHVPGGTN